MLLGKFQKCYGGVYFLDGAGPCLRNIERLDANAMPMVQHMQGRGLQTDLSHFAKMDVVLTRDMEEITEGIKKMTGYYCNLDSGDQIADLLFKKLGLKQARVKLTKSGDRESTENEVLVAIQHEHPVVPKILNYKELSKLRGTYVRPMPKLARRVAFGKWRMFPQFNTTRIPSGRMSCKEPNLLAMPSRTDRGKEIREGFITDEGWSFLSVDESQIEVRVAAHRSKDPNLIKIYENEEDIYSDFAISAFRLKDERYKGPDGVWKYPHVNKIDHRYPAKTCVLASIYDVTEVGLLDQMPIVCGNCGWISLPVGQKGYSEHSCRKFGPLWSEGKCLDLINAFYMEYSKLMVMRKTDHQRMLRTATVWDDWGRLQHVQAVRSVLDWVVNTALREGSNTPIQGTAQGTVKITMAAVMDDLETNNLLEVCQPLLQIHDELLFECRNDVLEEIGEMVKYRFETCVRLRVPIKAGIATADTWGSLPK